MNSYERASQDVKVTLKAYQNLMGAHQAFLRLASLTQSGDALVLQSVFSFAVVRYVRPFVDTKTSSGTTRFSLKALKSTPGFVATIHDHLLELRHGVIAHDDLHSIEPRILMMCLHLKAHATSIPVSVSASNMCLAFPAEISTVESFCTHVSACAQGAHEKLYSDLARVRQMALENPADARAGARYEKDYGPAVAGNGSWFQPPNVEKDEWLQVGPPNFAHARAGFHYETLQIRRDFNGPEKITLPNGKVIEIKPQAREPEGS